MSQYPLQVVVAWAEKTKLVPTDGHVVRDMNLFPAMRLEWEARAAMWVREGTPEDVEKAEAFAAKEGHTVYTFGQDEADPLDRARALAVEAAVALEQAAEEDMAVEPDAGVEPAVAPRPW